MQPLVTIAIPTYNRADRYLPEALKSAVRQTYSNIEIIVSDNCSTDNTESVVKSFNDKRIRFVRHLKNMGSYNNSNFCLEQANGAYFLLLFDDDQIDHDFVEACINAIQDEESVGVILTGAREIDAEGNILYECPNQGEGLSIDELFLAWFDGKVPLYLCSTLYNTKRLREIGGLHSRTYMYEDVIAEFKLAKLFGRKIVFDVKASYRRHSHNMGSSVSVRDWCEDSLYLLEIMCDLASKRKDFIRSKGMKHFCKRNYRRAAGLKSPVNRFFTYLFVFKTFEYKLFPPFINPFYYYNFFIRGARHLKRRLA